jgi:hypothetical protein
MRLVTTSFAALLLAVPVAACSVSGGDTDDTPGIAATGSGGERHFAVSGFDKIGLGSAGDVEVRTGQGFAVTATGDPATLDTLKVTRDGSTLGLGFKRGVHWTGASKVRWLVTMPQISEADIGGAGSVKIDRVMGSGFTGNIGGSGNIDVAAMRVDKASFNIGGSGDIAAAGTARSLDLSVGGSGKLKAQGLSAENASITIAGAGTVAATVKNHADVTIMGSGDVTIAGGAKCSVTKMGGGTVRCG